MMAIKPLLFLLLFSYCVGELEKGKLGCRRSKSSSKRLECVISAKDAESTSEQLPEDDGLDAVEVLSVRCLSGRGFEGEEEEIQGVEDEMEAVEAFGGQAMYSRSVNRPATLADYGEEISLRRVLEKISTSISRGRRDRINLWASVSHLTIESCPLKKVEHVDILSMPNLKSLNVLSNAASPLVFSKDAFSSSQLHTLSVHDSEGLSSLPRTLLCPVSHTLITLNVSSCSLRSLSSLPLSPSDCSVDTLRRLDLSGNLITRLPRRALSPTTDLEQLDLSSNNLAIVDDGALHGLGDSLRVLNLANNALTSLPVSLFSQDHSPVALRELYLSNNSLSGLPSGLMSRLTHLAVLNLSRNAVSNAWLNTRLSAFRRLTNLVALDLSHNRLTFLAESTLSGLKNLQVLNVAHNRIATVAPLALAPSGSALRALSLSHNQLEELEVGAFKGLSKLTSLSLDHNRLKSLHR